MPRCVQEIRLSHSQKLISKNSCEISVLHQFLIIMSNLTLMVVNITRNLQTVIFNLVSYPETSIIKFQFYFKDFKNDLLPLARDSISLILHLSSYYWNRGCNGFFQASHLNFIQHRFLCFMLIYTISQIINNHYRVSAGCKISKNFF